jgi:hypothetical protein
MWIECIPYLLAYKPPLRYKPPRLISPPPAEGRCPALTKFVWRTDHLHSKSLCYKPPPRGHLSRTGHMGGAYMPVNTVSVILIHSLRTYLSRSLCPFLPQRIDFWNLSRSANLRSSVPRKPDSCLVSSNFSHHTCAYPKVLESQHLSIVSLSSDISYISYILHSPNQILISTPCDTSFPLP